MSDGEIRIEDTGYTEELSDNTVTPSDTQTNRKDIESYGPDLKPFDFTKEGELRIGTIGSVDTTTMQVGIVWEDAPRTNGSSATVDGVLNFPMADFMSYHNWGILFVPTVKSKVIFFQRSNAKECCVLGFLPANYDKSPDKKEALS